MPVDDPNDLERVDQEIRENELRARFGAVHAEISPDCPPEISDDFIRRMEAFENGPFITQLDRLTRSGLVLPPPAELDDDALIAKLSELIEALARDRTYLSQTDHLSDRELYEHLWNESLREEVPDLPPDPDGAWHIDILGGCSEEDMFLSRKYYDSEEDRQRWHEEWPNDEMPPHEDPPYDRDRHLPQATYARPDDGDDSKADAGDELPF